MTGLSSRIVCVILGVVLAGSMSACANPKKSLGLERDVPDEYSVVPRAPLALPPDFAMRPPKPGAPRPQEVSSRDHARSLVTGSRGDHRDTASSGETSFMRLAGTNRADPDIRFIVNRESSILAEESRSFTDRLVFWRKAEEPGTAVDPEAEARRIRENQALGRPATEGRTPVIERKQRGLLEGIL
ncbi:DUF3035 domain-containing protein [Phaeovibrio sulfidiphilus]|uniref:DUF3035 domain-containing protein n=1 Tax=Phaeovibrio sulfidiphilus TaxID=1220600 RepID=A0A8J6YNV3_9PROT|nr:DUF3035 domain-containing protein [Phaeovibrio sulfidiphilus]MBE1236412.1 DUF3035 domain-containing protein [Phaeovibrio sulfidiphilus]